MSEVNPIEAVAKAIVAELARQDGYEEAAWVMEDGLKLAFLDQNNIDMGLVARAALTSLSENITPAMLEAGYEAGEKHPAFDPHGWDRTDLGYEAPGVLIFRAMLNQAMKEQG